MPNSPASRASELVSATRPCLDAAVVGVTRGGLQPGRRADDDDRPAVAGLDHRGHRRADGAPRAVQVDVDDGVPLLFGHLEHPAPAQHPGVGHHDVEPAELLDAVGHHLLQRGQVADVDLAGQHLAAGGLHRPDRLGQLFGGAERIGDGLRDRAADVDRDDVGALAGQPDRVRPALTARGPGNECHSPFQGAARCRHRCSFREAADQANSRTGTCSSRRHQSIASRMIGHVMQCPPPRPRPSSAPTIVMTSTPALRSSELVCVLRS